MKVVTDKLPFQTERTFRSVFCEEPYFFSTMLYESVRRPGKNISRESLHVSVGIGEPYSTFR
jgi:hypothetical protein